MRGCATEEVAATRLYRALLITLGEVLVSNREAGRVLQQQANVAATHSNTDAHRPLWGVASLYWGLHVHEVPSEFVDISGAERRLSRVALETWVMGGWMWGGAD